MDLTQFNDHDLTGYLRGLKEKELNLNESLAHLHAQMAKAHAEQDRRLRAVGSTDDRADWLNVGLR